MKAKNGSLLFAISLILVSCFDAPEFSNVPHIKLTDLYFGKSKRVDKADSLVISLNFEDGDGDLGLDNSYLSDPFHNYNYFVATSGGELLPVTKTELLPDYPDYYVLNIPPGTTGKLAVVHTRQTPPFDNLMVPYSPSTSCTNYSRLDPETHVDSVLVTPEFAALVDESYKNYERVTSRYGDFYLVRDTFYTEPNPNYYNLEVEMYRKGEDQPFDWTPYCPLSFNGRFPVLADPEKGNPLSGDITYSMTSSAIENIMGNSIWKLRILIRDRKLNESKAIETKYFTLDEIRR